MTTCWEHPPLDGIEAVLCDADGTLFPSADPAYAASALVINRFLAQLGIERPYEPVELQRLTNGRNFRSIARLLATLHDRHLDEDDLQEWVGVERDVVTAHLRTVLAPDPEVSQPICALAKDLPLAVVTSSALDRLRACLEMTGLAPVFTPDRMFSAEDSLATPTSKPDPAVHLLACERMGVDPSAALAVEDSVNGVRAAVAAGCRTVGTVQFVAVEERPSREAALRATGAEAIVESWSEVVRLLAHSPAGRTTPPLSDLR